MPEFVPAGYISIIEALNRIGSKLFGAEWTGEEHTARRGLISADDWSKIKDSPGASGSGMRPGGLIFPRPLVPPVTAKEAPPGRQKIAPTDPCDPLYQAEYRAAERYAAASQRLRVFLEASHLEGAIWDPWNGDLHPIPVRMWRQHDADRIIKSGRAQKPSGGNIGMVLVKRFADAVPAKSMPQAKIAEVIEALKQRTATESLTRAQQAEFVHNMFSSYHVTKRQLGQIFQQVPVLTGRPRKSNKKV